MNGHQEKHTSDNLGPLPSQIPREKLQELTRLLESIVEDRGLLLPLQEPELQRLLEAAGKVAHPGRSAKRRLVKAARQQRKQREQNVLKHDQTLLAQTGIRQSEGGSHRKTLGELRNEPAPPSSRQLQSAPPHPMSEMQLQEQYRLAREKALSVGLDSSASRLVGTLDKPRNCYICKADYRDLHFFYDAMCPSCAEFNWLKRNQSADLQGRFALVTGGRVKIGFEASLKLLRSGANLVVTTRFPNDAARRFAKQEDSADWMDRLQVIGLDMRHTPSVEAVANYLAQQLPRLDFILNNACQTVRRPPGFYQHLLDAEEQLQSELSSGQQCLLELQNDLVKRSGRARTDAIVDPKRPLLQGVLQAATLSQLVMLPEDELKHVFPAGHYDADEQQIDLRSKNSWRLKLDEVSTIELLEVHLVNAVAPYILNARLRGLMRKEQTGDKQIVNVSAMEGVFYRAFKRDTHPHTNMAKAALNMMTRTSAVDYIRDGIHMNSVDTGWITDEDPIEITHRKQREHGFSPPLDLIDAAARICDPVFHGVLTGEHVWGKFLKDYQVSNW